MPEVQRDLSIKNETKNLRLAREAIGELIDQSPFPPSARNQIIVAVDEAIANVVEHAYQGGEGLIDVRFALDHEKLTVEIKDNGVRFRPNLERKGTPDIKEHIRLGLDGGLGMFLMKRVMDEVRYFSSEEYTNQLAMVKFFPEAKAQQSPQETK